MHEGFQDKKSFFSHIVSILTPVFDDYCVIQGAIIYIFPLLIDQLKRIDLTGNQISELDEDAFCTLPQLQDLFLADNRIPSLPELPATMRHIDVRNNHLTNAGMHREGFKVSRECYKG